MQVLSGLLLGLIRSCHFYAILTGLIAGLLVVLSIIFFDKIKVDDPVGAISVHGICGIFGTLAVAFFSDAAPFGIQLVVLSVGVFAFSSSPL